MPTRPKAPRFADLTWINHADGRVSAGFTKRLRLQVMVGDINGARRFMAGVAEGDAGTNLVIAAFYPQNMADGKDLAYQLGVMVLPEFPDP